MTQDTLIHVPLTDLELDPANPREEMDYEYLQNLAASIVRNGLQQPIVVGSPNGDGHTRTVVMGARRVAAHDLINDNPTKFGLTAPLTTIAAIERDYASKAERLAAQLVENLQREDLNPVDEARAYIRLIDEGGMNQADIATAIGRNKSHISKRLSLLSLPEDVLWFVHNGIVGIDKALKLVPLAAHPKQLAKVFNVDTGDFSEYAVADELRKLEVKDRAAKAAKRLEQATDAPVIVVGNGGKAPRPKDGSVWAVMGRYVPASAWDGTVPDGCGYVTVTANVYATDPEIRFHTDDLKRVDSSKMDWSDRAKFQAALQKAGITDTGKRVARPEVSEGDEADHRRTIFIEQRLRTAREAHRRNVITKVVARPTDDQVQALVLDEILDTNYDDIYHEDITAHLGVEFKVEGEDPAIVDQLKAWAGQSKLNARRVLAFGILWRGIEYHDPNVLALVDQVQPFDEAGARADIEAELQAEDSEAEEADTAE